MIIDLKNRDLGLLYSKAKEKYYECINNSNNSFLKEEVPIPLETIELKGSSVKIVFHEEISNSYIFEISLILYDKNIKPIGKYIYMEDGIGNEIEDNLTFI